MRKQLIANEFNRLMCSVLLAVFLYSQPSPGFEERQKVYILAVRDTRFFAQCYPSSAKQKGRSSPYLTIVSLPPDRQRLKPPPRYRPELGPEIRPDLQIKRLAENEFRRRGKYMVVDSAEQADLIFMIESTYQPMFAATQTRPGTHGDTLVVMNEDQQANHLVTAVALVVPSKSYSQDPTVTALLDARLWDGIAGSINLQPASPEILVKEFHEQKKLPATDFKLCAAFQGPRAGALEPESSQNRVIIAPSRKRSPVKEENVIKVDVALVTVPVTVADAGGKYVPDLDITDFHVFEDNAEQKIDRLITVSEPWNMVLMLDTSSSVRARFEEIQRSALAFVEALRPQDRIMVVSFNSRIYVDSELMSDRIPLLRAISETQLGGSTRLYDAVQLTLTERLERIPGRKAIVLITDGGDTGSWLANSAGTVTQIEESNVLVYAIQHQTQNDTSHGIPTGWTPEVVPKNYFDNSEPYAQAAAYLNALSVASGGRLYHAEAIKNYDAAFARIAEELGHQYMLCYYPFNQKGDGVFHRIRVSVDRSGAVVQARSGYRAIAKPPPVK